MTAYHYHLEQGSADSPVLLVLHGTGGNEYDLLPLARQIGGEDATLLSLRGDVSENGQLRFFRRFDDGSFDQQDLAGRARAMADFLHDLTGTQGIDRSRLYAFGYSNGANMAAALMLLAPDLLAGGILLRATQPLDPVPEKLPELSNRHILVLSGMMDPLIPPEKGQELARIMEQAGASVTFKARIAGHELQPQDISEARNWLERVTAAPEQPATA